MSEVGMLLFRARLVLSAQRPGQRVTSNEAAAVLLAVNNLHRVGLSRWGGEADPVDPPCQVAS